MSRILRRLRAIYVEIFSIIITVVVIHHVIITVIIIIQTGVLQKLQPQRRRLIIKMSTRPVISLISLV